MRREAQEIMNSGIGLHPEDAAPLVDCASDDILYEVLGSTPQEGERAFGLVKLIESKLQKRDMAAQIASLRDASSNQISALHDVEAAIRDQITATENLAKKATQLEYAAIFVTIHA